MAAQHEEKLSAVQLFLKLMDDEKQLPAFLETFPTPLHHKEPESLDEPWVFWSEEEEGSRNNSSSANRTLCDKIKSALCDGRYLYVRLILQLWVPMTIGGIRLLSTSGQPFAVSCLDDRLAKYRLRCMEYQYNIDETNTNNLDAMIISGAASSAFLSRLTQRVHFNKQEGGSELDHYAFECKFKTCYMLPICCPSQSSSSCVGVLECSTDLTIPYKSVMLGLKNVGLNVIGVQERIPYKNINGLNSVKDDIEKALKIVCESHYIGLAQAWISYEDKSHVCFSSSSLEDTRKKRMSALKLTGYKVDEDSLAFQKTFQDYYYWCDKRPLHTGVELVEKTFQDYKPRYSKNVYNLMYYGMLMVCTLFDDDIKFSTLLICLRSINTGHFNYVFEFMWKYNSNFVILLESVLLTIKRCLPCFKFASGGELDDELHVIDVDSSTTSETQTFKIFQRKRVSPIPETSENGKIQAIKDYIANAEGKSKTAEIKLLREVIEQQFGKTQKEAAKNLSVHESTLKRKCRRIGILNWPGPDVVKKEKVNDLHNNQSKTNERLMTVNRNEDTLSIKAEYADDIIKFCLSISEATFKNIEKEIGKQFNLSVGTFKLKYKDEDGDWILLKSDQHMSDCIESCRNSDGTVVRLRVLQSVQQLCCPTVSSEIASI